MSNAIRNDSIYLGSRIFLVQDIDLANREQSSSVSIRFKPEEFGQEMDCYLD